MWLVVICQPCRDGSAGGSIGGGDDGRGDGGRDAGGDAGDEGGGRDAYLEGAPACTRPRMVIMTDSV